MCVLLCGPRRGLWSFAAGIDHGSLMQVHRFSRLYGFQNAVATAAQEDDEVRYAVEVAARNGDGMIKSHDQRVTRSPSSSLSENQEATVKETRRPQYWEPGNCARMCICPLLTPAAHVLKIWV